jgi:hypothetical protein
MAGTVTTLFASLLAFAAGGLFATPFTTYDDDSKNQGLAAINGFVFAGVAFYVGLDLFLFLGSLVTGLVVVGVATEVMR